MIPARLIERKRDGESIPPEDLRAFLSGYLDGTVEEYQMSAFLMATVFRGLDEGELSTLLSAMIGSGATLDLEHLPGPRVDKHSTGGVGDKVSLPLAPVAAAMGLFVPMMSGRGLGHTGGTLDKLESIPGFVTDLPLDRFTHVLETVGCAMIGQTAEIAPLDRRLYDLRSVTGTVPCTPLIAASIMSKKISEGLNGLVLDVKVGEGAFLPELEGARTLARTMVGLGERAGVRTIARLTAMDRPLGRTIGNALEVAEALDCLRGEGPADLRETVVELAAEMAVAARMVEQVEDGRDRAREALDSGAAMERFERMVAAQGGDPKWLADAAAHRSAPIQRAVVSPVGGRVSAVRPLGLGRAVVALGGGRARLGEQIDHRVGFELEVRPGVDITAGQALGVVHAASESAADAAEAALRTAVEFNGSSDPLPLLIERIGLDD